MREHRECSFNRNHSISLTSVINGIKRYIILLYRLISFIIYYITKAIIYYLTIAVYRPHRCERMADEIS